MENGSSNLKPSFQTLSSKLISVTFCNFSAGLYALEGSLYLGLRIGFRDFLKRQSVEQKRKKMEKMEEKKRQKEEKESPIVKEKLPKIFANGKTTDV